MSEVTNTPDVSPEEEMKLLKERADLMEIKYAPNIGLETLRERVNGKLKGNSDEESDNETTEPAAKAKSGGPGFKPKSIAELKAQAIVRDRNASLKLVRVVVQCMNPAKRQWPGEIITVGNGVVGTVKKFVPFGIEEGYHIPQIILDFLKQRKYQHFVKEPIPGTRQTKLIPTMSREFAIEVLPPLNAEQMQELAQRQALNKSID